VSTQSSEGFGPSALITPANALTAGRVLVTPVLVVLILRGGHRWLALGVWAILAATDCVDGLVARRQGATRSGAFLDPLADKVLVLGAMTALVAKGLLPWPPVAIIAVRELAVSAYRSHVGRRGVSVPARYWAKVKTVTQDLVVGLAVSPFVGTGQHPLVLVALWLAVVLTVVTGVQYLADGRAVLAPGA